MWTRRRTFIRFCQTIVLQKLGVWEFRGLERNSLTGASPQRSHSQRRDTKRGVIEMARTQCRLRLQQTLKSYLQQQSRFSNVVQQQARFSIISIQKQGLVISPKQCDCFLDGTFIEGLIYVSLKKKFV